MRGLEQITMAGTNALSLFRLPPELRINIYEFLVATDDVVCVKGTPRKVFNHQHLVCTTALIGASREANNELYPVLVKHAFNSARQIIAVVTDFNFRALMAFIADLKPTQVASLNHVSGPSLVAELHVMDGNLDPARFGTWLKFRKADGVLLTYIIGEVWDPQTFVYRMAVLERDMQEAKDVSNVVSALVDWDDRIVIRRAVALARLWR